MKKLTLFLILLILLALPSQVFAIACFPGAEGFGTDTEHAYGGLVTNSNIAVTCVNATGKITGTGVGTDLAVGDSLQLADSASNDDTVFIIDTYTSANDITVTPHPQDEGPTASVDVVEKPTVCIVNTLTYNASIAYTTRNGIGVATGGFSTLAQWNKGNRLIVFETSGTIELSADTIVDYPYMMIAGQTAPSPGIQIVDDIIKIESHDILTQHIRVRPNDAVNSTDAMWLFDEGNQDDVYNIVTDHCTFMWGSDENFSMYPSSGSAPLSHDITLSNSIVAEPITDHNYNSLILAEDVTYLKNIFMSGEQRNPSIREGTILQFVNNFIYNASYSNFSLASRTLLGHGGVTVSARGNVVEEGPSAWSGVHSQYLIHVGDYCGLAADQIYLDGNDCPSITGSDQWDGVLFGDLAAVSESDIKAVAEPAAVDTSGLTILSSEDVKASVIANAGAWPGDRDTAELRLMLECDSDGTEGSVVELKQTPISYSENTHSFDTAGDFPLPSDPHDDNKGYTHTGTAITSAAEAADGYTNLEEWIFAFSTHVEGVAYRYFHNGLATGDNDGTSWANAWQSEPDINFNVLEGLALDNPVYLYVKKGTTTTDKLNIDGSGSSDTNRIFITTDEGDTGANPIFAAASGTYSIDVNTEDYITFSNLHIHIPDVATAANDQNYGIFANQGASYITVDNCEIHTPNPESISSTDDWFNGVGFWYPNNALVSNCTIYDMTRGVIAQNGGTIITEDCLIHDADISQYGNADCIQYTAWAAVGVSDYSGSYVRRNECYDFADDGIDFYYGKNVVVEKNKVYQTEDYGSRVINGIKLGGAVGSGSQTCRYNKIYDIPCGSQDCAGIITNGGTGNVIYENLIYNCCRGIWMTNRDETTHAAYNNVCAKILDHACGGGDGVGTTSTWHNNVCDGNVNNDGSKDFITGCATTGGYNILVNDASASTFGDGAYTNTDNADQGSAGSAFFTNYASNDFTLVASGIATDAGKDVYSAGEQYHMAMKSTSVHPGNVEIGSQYDYGSSPFFEIGCFIDGTDPIPDPGSGNSAADAIAHFKAENDLTDERGGTSFTNNNSVIYDSATELAGSYSFDLENDPTDNDQSLSIANASLSDNFFGDVDVDVTEGTYIATVRVESLNGHLFICGVYDVPGNDKSVGLYVNDSGYAQFNVGYNSGASRIALINTSYIIQVGEEVTIAGAYDSVTDDGWVMIRGSDGSVKGADLYDSDVLPGGETWNQGAADFYVGGRDDDSSSFDGQIDEVGVFDKVLTSTDVTDWSVDDYTGGPSDWTRKCSLVIQASKIDATLTDFPVLLYDSAGTGNMPLEAVDQDDADGHLQADALDLKYFDSEPSNPNVDTDRQGIYLQEWTVDTDAGGGTSNGSMAAWSNVPSIASDTNTTFWTAYGATGKSQPAIDATYGQEDVWDSNFKAVWPMESDAVDLTSHDEDLTNSTAAFASATLGNGADFEDGDPDYMTIADGTDVDISGVDQEITIEAWVKPETVPGEGAYQYIVSKYCPDDNDRQYALFMHMVGGTLSYWFVLSNDGTVTTSCVSATAPAAATEHYVVAVYNDTDMRIYVNGALDSNGADNPKTYSSGIYDSASPFYLGCRADAVGCAAQDHHYDGLMDEVRISDTARSAAWIKATYESIKNPTTFIVEGTPGAVSASPTAVTISTIGVIADPSGTPSFTENPTATWSDNTTRYIGGKLTGPVTVTGISDWPRLPVTFDWPATDVNIPYWGKVTISGDDYLVWEYVPSIQERHTDFSLATSSVLDCDADNDSVNDCTVLDGNSNDLCDPANSDMPRDDIGGTGTITLAYPANGNDPLIVKPANGDATTVANLETALGSSGLLSGDYVVAQSSAESYTATAAGVTYRVLSLTDFDCDNLAVTIYGTNRISGTLSNSGSATLYPYNPPAVTVSN